MLIEAPGRFAATVQAGNHLPLHIHHLALLVDPQTGARVMHQRRGPGGIEWRRLDLVLRGRLAEIPIRPGVHTGVVTHHCRLQDGAAHLLGLLGIGDRGRELRQRVGVEAIAVRIHVRWGDLPLLAGHRVGIEDGLDRACREVCIIPLFPLFPSLIVEQIVHGSLKRFLHVTGPVLQQARYPGGEDRKVGKQKPP